jgi:hypothetical protein
MSLGDWTLTVTGEVVRIDRENVDKSGGNPRYFYSFVVRPSAPVEVPAGATIAAEPAIRVSGTDLARLIDAPPAEGDHVEMKARASGARPATLYLTAVRRLT